MRWAGEVCGMSKREHTLFAAIEEEVQKNFQVGAIEVAKEGCRERLCNAWESQDIPHSHFHFSLSFHCNSRVWDWYPVQQNRQHTRNPYLPHVHHFILQTNNIHFKKISIPHMFLVWCLVSMTPGGFLSPYTPLQQVMMTKMCCRWIIPKKRKEYVTPMGEAVFPKCDYGRWQKYTLKDFDPRPPEYRGTANNHLPTLLEKLRGKDLLISLTLDSKTQSWNDKCVRNDAVSQPETSKLPSKDETVERFKKSLHLPPDKCGEIDVKTRNQSSVYCGILYKNFELQHRILV